MIRISIFPSVFTSVSSESSVIFRYFSTLYAATEIVSTLSFIIHLHLCLAEKTLVFTPFDFLLSYQILFNNALLFRSNLHFQNAFYISFLYYYSHFQHTEWSESHIWNSFNSPERPPLITVPSHFANIEYLNKAKNSHQILTP